MFQSRRIQNYERDQDWFHHSHIWYFLELRRQTNIGIWRSFRLAMSDIQMPQQTIMVASSVRIWLLLLVVVMWIVVMLAVVDSVGPGNAAVHSKNKKYFQAPFLVLQLVTNRGHVSVPGRTRQYLESTTKGILGSIWTCTDSNCNIGVYSYLNPKCLLFFFQVMIGPSKFWH